ncbi:MAG: major capsid protein [Candidatus Kapaibacterium sp.]|uniref:Major structural protein n=1 Tax=Bordetella phage MW2 TaxID=1916126 RepID=A0A2D0W958_9CAUD|nr:major head protein [Bordetella phage MW2]APL99197.1 major structural protein [Bordetella phage MW2]
MSSVTLAESAKLAQDELVAGVIENIITVNRFFDVLPFDGIEGNSLAYNRENVLGDVINAGVGTTFSGAGAGKNPATFTRVNSNLTTIMGDAEVNGLIQATRSGDGNDQTAVQIASKAKSAGRQYQNQLINGTGTNNEFAGLLQLVAAGQTLTPQTNGQALSFEILDELMDRVVDKDGQVDYITMHARTLRSYKALLRALGGASINEVVELPSGAEVPAYSGVPIFRNDYIPTNQTQGSTSNATTIFAGTLDDGSRTHGIAGLTATTAAGIQVVDVGESEDADEHIWRVKWYCGLALFSEKGLAAAPGITN